MTQLIKIVRTLCKYFLPRPKKMCFYSKIKELRDKLVENCKYAIGPLERTVDIIEKGSSIFILEDRMNKTSSKTATSYSNPEGSEICLKTNDAPNAVHGSKSKDKIINDVYSVIHGVLIQEWEHFLYDLYAEGFVYYLNLGSPKSPLRLRQLNPKMEVADMRQHICEEVKNSFRSLKELFARTRSFFNVEETKLFMEMQKHIQIRHIFQHSKGEIRSSDLEDIGRKSFDILNDEGRVMSYGEGEDIPLSLPEIQKLYTVIEEYSEAFQKQAEKAKPVKAG